MSFILISYFYYVSGIGREVATMLVKCGAEVIALSRTQADLDTLRAEVSLIILYYLRLFLNYSL